MPFREDEYTDYSCSTSLESLSRDVETVLRTWHVDRGSDRHVSSSSSLLIRSNVIIWNFSIPKAEGGRSSITIDLELCLWDTLSSDNDFRKQDKNDSLIHSLRRPSFPKDVTHAWFDNFSNIFGVGQHISLAPICPHLESDLVEYLAPNILQRHDDISKAKTLLLTTMSSWLQQALNCATSNCQCYLPVFGVWGEYRPNQSSQIETPIKLLETQQHKPKTTNTSSNRSIISNTDTLLGTTIRTVGGGPDNPNRSPHPLVHPSWMFTDVQPLPTVGRKFRQRALNKFWNAKFVPPLISGCVISQTKCATMRLSHGQVKTAQLGEWANVLLSECPDTNVILCGARHVFEWAKPQLPVKRSLLSNYSNPITDDTTWRKPSEVILSQTGDNDMDRYRQHCRAQALDLLEEAWHVSDTNMFLWGAKEDPISSVHATAIWNSKESSGLVTFPLRIRSRQELSHRDHVEMEDSLLSSVLDPLQTPTRFGISCHKDREIASSTLAANQRVILASLIRAATLPGETLLQHLTDEGLVELWDDNAGTIVANKLSEKCKVSHKTLQLVEVMEWSSMINDMISQREAEAIVHQIFSSTVQFPDSPEDSFLSLNSRYTPFSKAAPVGRLVSLLFGQLARLQVLSSISLVWGIFVDELRRRWELRESLPNMQYVPGLDPHPNQLYKKRKHVKTIGKKAELAAFLNCSEPDPDDYHCLIGQKLQVFNLGIECIVASELLESEAMERFLGTGEVPATAAVSEDIQPPQPLDESFLDLELDLSVPGSKWLSSSTAQQHQQQTKTNYAPPAINADCEFWVMDEPGHHTQLSEAFDFVQPASALTNQNSLDNFDYHLQSASSNSSPRSSSPRNDTTGESLQQGESSSSSQKHKNKVTLFSSSSKNHKEQPNSHSNNLQSKIQESIQSMDTSPSGPIEEDDFSVASTTAFFDAAEAGSIFSMKNGFLNLDTTVAPEISRRRPGARCPVQGTLISKSGDQLYAPYLQRPCPLTDDLVLEKRVILSDRMAGNSINNIKKQQALLASRLEVAQRLQKSKLLSDMCAFKAANPGANLDDFTKWYGNPENPLDDYSPVIEKKSIRLKDWLAESAAKKLDKASEAMKIMTSTRDFWTATWETATPVPAAEQEPLFDYASTVEMTIDYLEQMHPASLLNQIMAVNLSSAYFILIASSTESCKIDVVASAFSKLREKIEVALDILSKDAMGESMHFLASTSSDSHSNKSGSVATNRFVSVPAIRACEDACSILGITETIVARATSLLHKFPNQYQLVQDLLWHDDGTKVPLTDTKGRCYFLNIAYKHQTNYQGATSAIPKPVLRDYVFRNLDDGNPCQLSVRASSSRNISDDKNDTNDVLMALLKTFDD